MNLEYASMFEPDLAIILIGGASATGKTTLGESLAHHLQCRYIDLDLFWIVLQRAIPAEVEPDLQLFDPDSIWLLPVHELVDRYLRVASVIGRTVEPLIAHHNITGRPVVIEGCWLLPEFATQGVYAGFPVDAVRAVFLHEPSLVEFDARIASRARPQPSFFFTHPEAQRNDALMQHHFGLEIKRRAQTLELPVIDSRPFDTLLARTLAILGGP